MVCCTPLLIFLTPGPPQGIDVAMQGHLHMQAVAHANPGLHPCHVFDRVLVIATLCLIRRDYRGLVSLRCVRPSWSD